MISENSRVGKLTKGREYLPFKKRREEPGKCAGSSAAVWVAGTCLFLPGVFVYTGCICLFRNRFASFSTGSGVSKNQCNRFLRSCAALLGKAHQVLHPALPSISGDDSRRESGGFSCLSPFGSTPDL